jgi:hypothetical protein
MRTTTMLEVMAEVGALARGESKTARDADACMLRLRELADEAWYGATDSRREALRSAAVFAILALHAHDAEAVKAGA